MRSPHDVFEVGHPATKEAYVPSPGDKGAEQRWARGELQFEATPPAADLAGLCTPVKMEPQDSPKAAAEALHPEDPDYVAWNHSNSSHHS